MRLTRLATGLAYEALGSVYFDVTAFSSRPEHCYGKLHKAALQDVARAMDGEGALMSDENGKRCSSDFVLWKRSKTGEPCWASPWGTGRPGWHIECSVMCSDVLGGAVDINCGGVDLAFPHHENQLAQSEAFWGTQQWVNFFLHTGALCGVRFARECAPRSCSTHAHTCLDVQAICTLRGSR